MWGLKPVLCICSIVMTSFMAFTSSASITTQPGMTNVPGAMEVQNNQSVDNIALALNINPNVTGEVYVAGKGYLEHPDEAAQYNEQNNNKTGDLAYHAHNPKFNDVELQEDNIAPTKPSVVVKESEEIEAIFAGDSIAVPLVNTMDADDEYEENINKDNDEVFKSSTKSSKDKEDINTSAGDGNDNILQDEELSKPHDKQIQKTNNKDEITQNVDQSVEEQTLEEQVIVTQSVDENNYDSINSLNIINNLHDKVLKPVRSLIAEILNKNLTYEPDCRNVIVTRDLINILKKETDALDRLIEKGSYAKLISSIGRMPGDAYNLSKLTQLLENIILHQSNNESKLFQMIMIDKGHCVKLKYEFYPTPIGLSITKHINREISRKRHSEYDELLDDTVENVIKSLEIANEEIKRKGRRCEFYHRKEANEKNKVGDQFNEKKILDKTLDEEK